LHFFLENETKETFAVLLSLKMLEVSVYVLRYNIVPRLTAVDVMALKATCKRLWFKISDLTVVSMRLLELEVFLKTGPTPFENGAVFGNYGDMGALYKLPKLVFWYSFMELKRDRPHFAGPILKLMVDHLRVPWMMTPPHALPGCERNSPVEMEFDERFPGSIAALILNLEKSFEVEPHVVYLVLCVVDWYLPRLIAAGLYTQVSLGCVARHAAFRGTFPPDGLTSRGESSLQLWQRWNPNVLPCDILSFVLAPLLKELHPVHHFPLAVELISSLENYFEEQYITPKIWKLGGLVAGRLGGVYRLDYDGGKRHELSKIDWARWREDQERNDSEQACLREWLDNYEDYTGPTLDAICDMLDHKFHI
jgi:hypothetical protein